MALCPSGHACTACASPDGLQCDGCGVAIAPNEAHLTCAKCDFDLCASCGAGKELSDATMAEVDEEEEVDEAAAAAAAVAREAALIRQHRLLSSTKGWLEAKEDA
eukprot:2394597-Prymnesium_polylepis.1